MAEEQSGPTDAHTAAAHQAAKARENARKAQLAAADSFERSALAHERAADVYDRAAEYTNLNPTEQREAARRHRRAAADDYAMAERTRRQAQIE
jgi:hypothetical protein